MHGFKLSRYAVLLTFAYLTLSTVWADLIVLKDGDRITGVIVKKDGQQ